jgi:hypothetical protein
MIRFRVCVIVGLAGVVAMLPENASTQDCPEWLEWACSIGAPSISLREVVPRERHRARTSRASRSQMKRTKHVRAVPDSATRQQTKHWDATNPLNAAGNRSSNPTGHQPPAEYEHDVMTSDQEKEVLFQEFLAWQKVHRLDAHANGDPSGDQRSPVMNDQEKEALFQEFSAWQKARRAAH